MQIAYDLLLQPLDRAAPIELASLEAPIVERGATRRADGVLVWRLAAGDITVSPLREGGAVLGLQLRVPFSDRTELLTQTLAAAVELGRAHGCSVVDPQLGRTVLELDGASVTDSFLRISRYAGQYFGMGDALPMAPSASGPNDDAMSPAVKGLLALGVFGVALALAYRLFSPD